MTIIGPGWAIKRIRGNGLPGIEKTGVFMESTDFTVIFYLMMALGLASAFIHFMTVSKIRAKARADVRKVLKSEN